MKIKRITYNVKTGESIMDEVEEEEVKVQENKPIQQTETLEDAIKRLDESVKILIKDNL